MNPRAYLRVVLSLACLTLLLSVHSAGTKAAVAQTTAIASPVTLIEPVGGATVYAPQPRYIWSRAAGGLRYDLHVSTDREFTSPEVVENLSDTTRWQLSPLPLGTCYWWKVISRDSLGGTAESDVDSFYTYLPGDANVSRDVTVADIIAVVNLVFKSIPLPVPDCAADVDGEAGVTAVDIIYLVGYVFRGGPPPAPACVPEGSLYWPLAEGNYWLYELCWGTQPCMDSAHRMEVVDRGPDTAIVVGQPWWNDTLSLRQLGAAIDRRWPDTTWSPFYRFEPGTWMRPPEGLTCNDTVFFAIPETDSIVTPAGVFHDCLRIQSVAHCSDAGMIAEWWAPGVGLVAWVRDNVAGYQFFYLTDYRAQPE